MNTPTPSPLTPEEVAEAESLCTSSDLAWERSYMARAIATIRHQEQEINRLNVIKKSLDDLLIEQGREIARANRHCVNTAKERDHLEGQVKEATELSRAFLDYSFKDKCHCDADVDYTCRRCELRSEIESTLTRLEGGKE